MKAFQEVGFSTANLRMDGFVVGLHGEINGNNSFCVSLIVYIQACVTKSLQWLMRVKGYNNERYENKIHFINRNAETSDAYNYFVLQKGKWLCVEFTWLLSVTTLASCSQVNILKRINYFCMCLKRKQQMADCYF